MKEEPLKDLEANNQGSPHWRARVKSMGINRAAIGGYRGGYVRRLYLIQRNGITAKTIISIDGSGIT